MAQTYRQIYCEYSQAFIGAWSDSLTTCPENASHNVAENSETIVKAARLGQNIGGPFSTSSTSFVNVGSFFYQGTNYYVNDSVLPKYLKTVASVSVGTFNLRLVDANNNVLWAPSGYTGSTNQTIIFDFDTITPPANEILLTLQAKTTGGACNIANAAVFITVSPQ